MLLGSKLKSDTCIDQLESEAIYIMREVAGQFSRPCLLFSGGKDSTVLAHLAKKAFWPGRFPFPLMHIDTGHNFEETIQFRDQLVRDMGEELIVRYVQDSIDGGRAQEETGPHASRNALQTTTLLDAISELKFDALMGGARRDEEKSRAKERVFSVRDEFGQWVPDNQRPEPWCLYNGWIRPYENVRVFPISNWTEWDVWCYIKQESLAIPSIYFSHQRSCVRRDDHWFPDSDYLYRYDDDQVVSKTVRFRTVGDMTCTAAIESSAKTVDDILDEIRHVKYTERGSRLDDKRSDVAMEERKRAGYF